MKKFLSGVMFGLIISTVASSIINFIVTLCNYFTARLQYSMLQFLPQEEEEEGYKQPQIGFLIDSEEEEYYDEEEGEDE